MRALPRPLGLEPYVVYTRRFFGRWARFYDLFAASIGFAYRRAVAELAPAPGRTVLDVCAGTGQIAVRCASRGARVTGIDLTPAMLARARDRSRGLPLDLRVMDARQLTFPDRSFDAVCLSFALHDMPPRVGRQVLAEAARVCRERLVVLDYELSPRPLAHRLVRAGLGFVETPYFLAWAERGIVAALADAGLPGGRRRTIVPGAIALHSLPMRTEEG